MDYHWIYSNYALLSYIPRYIVKDRKYHTVIKVPYILLNSPRYHGNQSSLMKHIFPVLFRFRSWNYCFVDGASVAK